MVTGGGISKILEPFGGMGIVDVVLGEAFSIYEKMKNVDVLGGLIHEYTAVFDQFGAPKVTELKEKLDLFLMGNVTLAQVSDQTLTWHQP